jgi:hypothetical protein
VNEVTPPVPPPIRPKSGMRVLSLFDGISTGKNSSPQHWIICHILDTHKYKSTCYMSLTAGSLSYIECNGISTVDKFGMRLRVNDVNSMFYRKGFFAFCICSRGVKVYKSNE